MCAVCSTLRSTGRQPSSMDPCLLGFCLPLSRTVGWLHIKLYDLLELWVKAAFSTSKMAAFRHVNIWNSTKWWSIVEHILFPSSSLAYFCRVLCYRHQRTIYALCWVSTHKTPLHRSSLMCWRLLIMRFLKDGKLQGPWLTAHFKHCGLPLLLLSWGTERMKWE